MSEPSAAPLPAAAPGPLRSVTGVGSVASILIALVAACDLVMSWAVWHTLGVLEDYAARNATTQDLKAADQLTATVGRLTLGLTALAAIVFLLWSWSARLNAEAHSPVRHRHARGWVIAGWLPVVNLWFPYHIITDIWRTSRPEARTPGTTEITDLPGSRLVSLWWLSFLLSTIVQRLIYSLQLAGATSLEEFRAGASEYTAANLVLAASAVLIILVIRRISDWQRMAREAVPPQPVPGV
ncbi:DUF4328 domain-containing protein [Amycolatopsis rhizosphaerae]|uniref:DUF4328 domain-containing protein n=1 Tax=Amycolatopsis rhizosphaerae TaxID=2053003 RepID=A0A558AVN2_9PSEU|nr:DUF4328 domain-containing protein [Amycolatopsis rhizosphaerae]TVT28324.1 DUF4328 domain-containing protein [Amycolatopsis rhizosphaerae]